jgi:hypothetical protein
MSERYERTAEEWANPSLYIARLERLVYGASRDVLKAARYDWIMQNLDYGSLTMQYVGEVDRLGIPLPGERHFIETAQELVLLIGRETKGEL